ncbi:MAG TPA: hypothetical protein VF407_03480, partial [Polyangiaceae bacterium]
IQLFPAPIWDEYVAVEGGRYDIADLLAARNVDLVFVRRDTPQAAFALKATHKWKVTYVDDIAAVVERTP